MLVYLCATRVRLCSCLIISRSCFVNFTCMLITGHGQTSSVPTKQCTASSSSQQRRGAHRRKMPRTNAVWPAAHPHPFYTSAVPLPARNGLGLWGHLLSKLSLSKLSTSFVSPFSSRYVVYVCIFHVMWCGNSKRSLLFCSVL